MKSISVPSLEILPLIASAGGMTLSGSLILPEKAEGVILVIRNEEGLCGQLCDHCIARVFSRHRLATLLFELDAPPESDEMASQIHQIATSVKQDGRLSNLPLGCLAVGAWAMGAFAVAGRKDSLFHAIGVLSGHVEKMDSVLSRISVPVMLVAAGNEDNIQSQQNAFAKIKSPKALHIIPNASSSLKEPGAVTDAAQLSALWFANHLGKANI